MAYDQMLRMLDPKWRRMLESKWRRMLEPKMLEPKWLTTLEPKMLEPTWLWKFAYILRSVSMCPAAPAVSAVKWDGGCSSRKVGWRCLAL